MHVNRAHFRNFEDNNTNLFKSAFSYFWKLNLTKKLRKLDRLVVLTESDKKAWKELHNVEVIQNPLPFVSQAKSSLSQKRVIMIGRYSYEKGTDLLLKTWSKIEKEVQDWQLEIYGEGNKIEYEQLAKQLGIDSKRCNMHGVSHNVEKIFSTSSILVCSSRYEGFGLTMIEAMAFGIPVVSFDCEWGPRSIISEGEDGILAKREDIDDLANKILFLIKDEKKLKSMATKAIQKAKKYEIDEIIKKWQMLFNQL
jgi:glycosyltransferase involved in cell wall biosynthesis